MDRSNYEQKMLGFCNKVFKKVLEYSEYKQEVNYLSSKVLFLGLLLTPNQTSHINWDMVYVYKALQERGIKCRIHDPHIKASEGLAMGLLMGRRSQDESWSYSYDALVLSCPHLYYLQNMDKLAKLLNPEKMGVIIDVYGAFAKAYAVGNFIDIANFHSDAKEAELMGGLFNGLPSGYLN